MARARKMAPTFISNVSTIVPDPVLYSKSLLLILFQEITGIDIIRQLLITLCEQNAVKMCAEFSTKYMAQSNGTKGLQLRVPSIPELLNLGAEFRS